MTDTAVILAGGFGTRLKAEIGDIPKPMAVVNGAPFLEYLFRYLKHYHISNVILSTGHLADKISSNYGNSHLGISIVYAEERSPLGTGGGLRNALRSSRTNTVIAMNGDSFFDINLEEFVDRHSASHGRFSIALRKVEDAGRYGSVVTASDGKITAFNEKTPESADGLINAGVYAINSEWFLSSTEADVNFSLENDFFPRQAAREALHGFPFEGYFIDIGVPDDFRRAQDDFTRFKY